MNQELSVGSPNTKKIMDYAEFKKRLIVYQDDIYHDVLVENRSIIRVKKEHTIIKNLEKIFEATLKISNKKGFQAMTMRNLSEESGLSMGALYAYFSTKDELIEMLQRQHAKMMNLMFNDQIKPEMDPEKKLQTAIRTHLYLSEAMQPWFYFAYMETKNMVRAKQEKAKASELASEKIFSDILLEGITKGIFGVHHHELTASLIKAVLQDWYLKRWKYRGRDISVDQYAQFVIGFVSRFLFAPAQ